MKTATAQVNAKYQIILPKEVRKALGVKPHEQVIFLIDGDYAYLRPRPQSFTEKLSGLHAHIWRKPADKWLKEERRSWDE